MASNLWDTEHDIISRANSWASINTLYLLMDKGLISREDAAGVLTKTANQVREGSEDGPHSELGEQVSRRFEAMAAWCLSYSPSS